jgi:hypothetical protein
LSGKQSANVLPFEHLLALVDGELIRREFVDRLPLLAQAFVHRIGAVDEIVERHFGKALGEIFAECLEVRLRVDRIVCEQRLRRAGDEDDREKEFAQHLEILPFRLFPARLLNFCRQ